MPRFLFPLLVLAPLLMTLPVHAAWLHECPVRADGGAPRYLVNEQARMPGCASVALAPGARVETIYPLGPQDQPAATIILLGEMDQGRFAVSEHELPQTQTAPAAPGPMPLHTDLLPRMQARSFGVEERVQAGLQDGRLRMTCRPGSRPAGVILSGPWYLPRARVALAVRQAGDAGFAWQAADRQRAARDDALDMAVLPAAAGQQGTRLALPPGLERGAWRHFTILCPSGGGSLALDSLSLEPAGPPKTAPRSTWAWRPGDWIDNGPALVAWAAGQGIQDLFITVPLKDGAAVRAPELLAAFVRQAGARGLRVHSVDGDPRMVLAEELPAAVRRARAYAAYNQAAAPDARLAGMQFDVEPYLLPEATLAAAERDARYLAMAQALKAAAGPLRLEFVVPFWWGGKGALLDRLAAAADSLAVMDYRTDPGQVYDAAVPFLDWAAVHGKQVRIALEAGPIAPRTQRRYVRAAAGEPGDLQVLEIGGRRVLALLGAPASAPDALVYRLQSTREIDGSATTFHQDKAALSRLLPRLESDFGAWDGFGGIAVHEYR
jgi:hypothetical protein